MEEANYYERYYQELEACPWGRDRYDLERWAVITSWDETRTARDLLKFPSSAWLNPGPRLAVKAVRKIFNDGLEPDPMLILHTARQLEPDGWLEVAYLEELYKDNIRNIAGLQRTAIMLFRREYQWELAVGTLQNAAKGVRNKDYEEWFGEIHRLLLTLAPGSDQDPEWRNMSELLDEEWEKLLHPDDNPENVPRPSGFPELDRNIGGGFYLCDNILVVGAPGHGKTTYMKQQGVNLSMIGVLCAFMSLEMRANKMAKRALAQNRQVPMNLLNFKKDIPLARKLLYCYKNLHFSQKPCKVQDYVARVSNWKYKNPDGFALFTDYFGALQNHGSKHPVEAANMVADAWFQTGKTVGLCSFMGAQPTKNDYRRAKKPDLAFIRETGKLEQHADVIIWIHSPHEFEPNKYPENYVQFWLLKSREGARNKIVHVNWNKACFTMKPWVGELPDGVMPSGDVAATKDTRDIPEPLDEYLDGIDLP